MDVALSGSLDGVFAARGDLAPVPRTVDAFEWKGSNSGCDAADRFRRQRDQIRITEHETEIPTIHDHRQRIANQEQALPVMAVGPMQGSGAFEVATGVDERH